MTKCQLIITLLFTIYFNSLQNILLSSFECHPNFYAILYANEVLKWRHFISQLAELRPIYNSWRQYQTINTESEYLSILSNMSSQVIVLCSIQYCSVSSIASSEGISDININLRNISDIAPWPHLQDPRWPPPPTSTCRQATCSCPRCQWPPSAHHPALTTSTRPGIATIFVFVHRLRKSLVAQTSNRDGVCFQSVIHISIEY